jgi:hypothetical protein
MMPRRVLPLAALLVLAGGVPAAAYVGIRASTEVHISVAKLGAPGVEAVRVADDVRITPVTPTDGPAPTSYGVVRHADGADDVELCPLLAPGQACTDRDPVEGASYVVTAWLGTGWSHDSEPVEVP